MARSAAPSAPPVVHSAERTMQGMAATLTSLKCLATTPPVEALLYSIDTPALTSAT